MDIKLLICISQEVKILANHRGTLQH